MPPPDPPRVDAALLAELLHCHGAALERYAQQWTTSASDCVQEALLELARQTERPENPVPWLYKVVRRRGLNAARAARRQTARERRVAQDRDEAAEVQYDVAEKLALYEAMERLSPDERELVTLRCWSGLSWQEISVVTGVSTSAAHRRYGAALDRLKRLLEGFPCAKL